MGGRCAEKIIFSDTTTGAGNDIAVATDIAKRMVCEWGMSDSLGPLKYGRPESEVFLGKDYNEKSNTSDHVSELIDQEISQFIKNAEKKAIDLINTNIDKLHDLSKALLEEETIVSDRFQDIMKNGYSEINSSNENPEEPKEEKRVRRKSNTTPQD